MDVKPFKQGDARWSNKRVGFGIQTFSQVGCTVTALTCLINYLQNSNLTPDQVNDQLKAVKAFSDGVTIGKGNLLVWARVPMAFPVLRWVKRVRNYNNSEVSWYIYVKQTPVMVEVYLAQGNNRIKHWVLFTGNKKMVDPITGRIESTSKYKELTGYSLYNK